MHAFRSGVTNGGSPTNCVEPGPGSAAADAGQSLPDISDYLKDIPLDWLSDAANLLNHTLQFDCLTPNAGRSGVSGGSNSAVIDDGEVSAIVRGAKQVRVPPGQHCTACTNSNNRKSDPGVCPGVYRCRIDPLCFLARWRKRRLNQAFSFVLV